MVDLDLWANCVVNEFFTPEGANVNPQSNWPFPSQCPPVPWTPEQQRKYAEEQLKNIPESPL